MAKLKFIRGKKAKYNASTHADAVYFATDEKVIIVNGVEYVGNLSSVAASLNDKQDALTSDNAGTGIKIENGVISSTLDMTLFRVVAELPTENIEDNKIYLVASDEQDSEGKNVYAEWVRANGDWEKIGEYKSEVDLSPYLKSADAKTLSIKLGGEEAEAETYKPTADKTVVITPAAIGAPTTSAFNNVVEQLEWVDVPEGE